MQNSGRLVSFLQYPSGCWDARLWSPKIFTVLLGETGYAIWSGGDVYFVFVDVALNLQHLLPMMSLAICKFYLKVNNKISRGLSFNISCHYIMIFYTCSGQRRKNPASWSCVVLSCYTFL